MSLGEARAAWEVGGAVRMVAGAAPGSRLFIRIRPRPDIHERMVAFEDNATGVCRYRPPRKLFQIRATAGSWSCVLAATLGWLGAAQFRVTW